MRPLKGVILFAKPSEDVNLEKAIDNLHLRMYAMDETSEDYEKLTRRLSELYALKQDYTPPRLSPDVIAQVLGNLAVALIVVKYERENVVTTKVMQFLMKLR